MVTETGQYVSSQEVFGLLLQHLLFSREINGAVAKTISSTRMIDLLYQQAGVKLYETPVGFKHISRKMLSNGVVVGGGKRWDRV